MLRSDFEVASAYALTAAGGRSASHAYMSWTAPQLAQQELQRHEAATAGAAASAGHC
jgi:hypothetical protein